MYLESDKIYTAVDSAGLEEMRRERDAYAELLAKLIRLQCPEFATCCKDTGDRELVNLFLAEHGEDAFDELRGVL